MSSNQSIPAHSWRNRAFPVGDVSPEVQPFWELLKQHRFCLCTCKRCGRQYWPYSLCTGHADIPDFSEVEWKDASGEGTIFSHIIVHQTNDPGFVDELPYALALVQLREGPLFAARIIADTVDSVKIGLPVRVALVDLPGGWTAPFFELVTDGSASAV
ncbi:MAG: OB-fold domain-containing protein [Devosia sp.]|nr:OB-fold domain-containing protein [Devosia sp.]